MARLRASRGGRRVLVTAPVAALAVIALAIAARLWHLAGAERTPAHGSLVLSAREPFPGPARTQHDHLERRGDCREHGRDGQRLRVGGPRPEHGTAQTWADFIAGLLHGSELPRLTAYIAPFAEMQSICGEHAFGCYGSNRMVSMGETNYGVSAEEVVRHEYGHHIGTFVNLVLNGLALQRAQGDEPPRVELVVRLLEDAIGGRARSSTRPRTRPGGA